MIDKVKKFFLNIFEVSKNFVFKNKYFIFFILFFVLNGLILRGFTVGRIFSFKPFFCDLMMALLIGSFGFLIKKKGQFAYYFGFLLFFVILSIINSVYYTFYKSFVSVNLLSTLKMLGTVSDSVTNKLELYHFTYLLLPLFFFIIHKYYVRKDENNKKSIVSKKSFLVVLGISIVGLGLVGCTLSKREASRFIKQWNREYNVQRFGIYVYTFNDLFQGLAPKVSGIFGYDKAVNKYKEFYMNNDYTLEKNEYTNIFKDKNVIFIHAESVQTFLIDLKINGVEITPNLNKLSRNGIYFSKFYPQISVGTSSDTEYTLTTGLLPSTNGTVFVNYYNRTYEAMPQMFKDMGYYTFSMHGNFGNYWNRDLMYNSLGYEHFYSHDEYDVPDDKTSPDWVGLGLSDKAFFKQSVDKLVEIRKEHKKFMGLMITLSNHSPFNDLEKYPKLDLSLKVNKDTGKVDSNGKPIFEDTIAPYLEDTFMGNYIKSAHYADEALGDLLKLVEDAKLDDTVFILYGDHEAKLGKKAFDLLYNYDPLTDDLKDSSDPSYVDINTYTYDLLTNTPLIIWNNDKSIAKKVDDVMGMYDVMPTVGNMFGFKPNYGMGHDIFSNHEKIVIFPNGNFITNKVYYNDSNDKYISFDNEPIDAEYINRLKDYVSERLEVSKDIRVYDLVKKIGKIEYEKKENK